MTEDVTMQKPVHCKSMNWFLYDNGLCHERVKICTLCLLFLSSHIFIALEFDSNHFGVLLWKLVNPRDHSEIKPPIGKIFRKYKPIRYICYCPENNCRAHLQTKFTTIATRYPTSKRNPLTGKTFFRKN